MNLLSPNVEELVGEQQIQSLRAQIQGLRLFYSFFFFFFLVLRNTDLQKSGRDSPGVTLGWHSCYVRCNNTFNVIKF